MRLTHFALALTAILLCITGYLAWEGQQEIKGLKKERDFERQQRLAEQAARPDASQMVPLPTEPAAKVTPPPAPGTIAPPPAAAMPADTTGGDRLVGLPGGGLTVPRAVSDAEAQGISTNTLTPIQQRVLAAKAVAKIKTVVKEQGFVVIEGGSDQGLAKGQKYDVRRANAVLARITVTDAVEATEAVADLDFSSIPAGVELEPGDELIAPVER